MTNPSERLLAYDFARSLALLDMILFHFALVMSGSKTESDPLAFIPAALDGRAAALFMILAGVGLTLLSRKSVQAGEPTRIQATAKTIRRRGLILFAFGFLNLLIWPGDILRVYGLSFLIASCFIAASPRALWVMICAFITGFIVLLGCLEYDTNWDWSTLTYHNLWTLRGAIRNLFYDGFRTVFPWTALLFFGMWLGRQDFQNHTIRRKFFWLGAFITATALITSRLLLAYFQKHPHGMTPEEITALFGLISMPPLPLFLLSGIGPALCIITLSFTIVECFPSARLVQSLIHTGQLALTWYVGHIILGLGAVVALGWTDNIPLFRSLTTGLIFFLLAITISYLWKKRFKQGPLETLLRRISSTASS